MQVATVSTSTNRLLTNVEDESNELEAAISQSEGVIRGLQRAMEEEEARYQEERAFWFGP